MIELNNVTKKYSQRIVALNRVALKINASEFVCLVGASGAGKTTLLKLILGSEKPSDGSVRVGDFLVSSLNRRKLAEYRQTLGFVFQDNRLLKSRTVAENVALPLEIRNEKKIEISKKVDACLEMVGLGCRKNEFPLSLSGGEQQRVSFARAIVHSPKLIIADEPTGNLDFQRASEIFELLERVNSNGVGVLVASHNLPLTEKFGKRTIVIDRGEIIGDFFNDQKKVVNASI